MHRSISPCASGLAVLAVALLAACGSSSSEQDESTSSAVVRGTQGPPIIVRPPPPPIYNAYVGGLGCITVIGSHGGWYGSPTFPGDPAFCTYEWDGDWAWSLGDVLINGLVSHGVDAADITIDATCTNSGCAHPYVRQLPDSGIIIGGSVNCVKCTHASVVDAVSSPIAGATLSLHVALAPSLVTAGPSRMQALVDENIVDFEQPGGVAAFSVGLTDVPADSLRVALIPGPDGAIVHQ